jgi:hypothetical protein
MIPDFVQRVEALVDSSSARHLPTTSALSRTILGLLQVGRSFAGVAESHTARSQSSRRSSGGSEGADHHAETQLIADVAVGAALSLLMVRHVRPGR